MNPEIKSTESSLNNTKITHNNETRIFRAMRKMIRAIDIHSHKLSTQHHITSPQLVCLHAIQSLQECTISQLSKTVQLSPSTLVGIIDRLELKSFVKRTRDKKDRRNVKITLTHHGEKIVSGSPSPLQDTLSNKFSKLDELEQNTIVLALERVVRLMSAENIDAAPILETGHVQSTSQISHNEKLYDLEKENQLELVSKKNNSKITFRTPVVSDGPKVYQLIKNSENLDLNSCYYYNLLCKDYTSTCIVAEKDSKIIGFVSSYINPNHHDILFIWQVAVKNEFQGKGIAKNLIFEILKRPVCHKVRYLETTVTESNMASKTLFHKIADALCTTLNQEILFDKNLFPGKDHESEILYRIGPINIS